MKLVTLAYTNRAFRYSCWVGLLMLLASCADDRKSNDNERNAPRSVAAAARIAQLEVGVAVSRSVTAEQSAVIAREFTSISPENAMKWSQLEPVLGSYDFSRTDQIIESAVANGQRIRGHTLFWSRLSGLPPWIKGEISTTGDPAARLQALMIAHTNVVVGRYAGQLAQWDVINEPLALVGGAFDPDNVFHQHLGEAYIDIALLQAHAADPSAELFINETFIEFEPEKFDALIALAQRVLDRGAPLHGIGLQGHFFLRAPDKATLQDQLQRIADLGLKAEITELDIPLPLFSDSADPLDAQAKAYEDVFNACLAVTLCSGITIWGLGDFDTWLDSFALTAANAPNQPLLFDEKLFPKPAYYRVVELLENAPR